jgi:hypothetical protein
MTDNSPRATAESHDAVFDTVACPECRQAAEVQWRTTLDSTSGPVEHLKIRCIAGHWFFLPASCLIVS